ncbi:MAG: 50S ribosomal protein L25 [Parcubacteria group bacterium GW2011_GWB1_45_9]|nr:MAG: 50S ribosomal protein L25 [Parcubacteria group bacterium GW2011_GWB1_45_9]
MELIVQQREKFGKAVKALREAGMIPAELYGRGADNLHLSVAAKEFAKIFKEAGEHTIINVVVDENKYPVLINDVDYDQISGLPRHIDFYRVRMDEKIKTKVPFVFVGEAPAVKEKGGILTKVMHEVEVEVLPADLPREFQVDLSRLDDLEKSIHVSDLKIPSGVKILVDADAAVVTIKAFVEEEVAVEAPKVEDVKVETEEKVQERKKEKDTKETKETAEETK